MLQIPVAKVAVLAATFAFDRPYTYKIPQPLTDTLRPGCRVMVPFSRGNRPCEGMVLALDQAQDDPKLKPITRQLDPEPILSPELIRLAIWMHDRFFCTIYDALHAILPAGVWYRVSTVYCAAPLDIALRRTVAIADIFSMLKQLVRRDHSVKRRACNEEVVRSVDLAGARGARRGRDGKAHVIAQAHQARDDRALSGARGAGDQDQLPSLVVHIISPPVSVSVASTRACTASGGSAESTAWPVSMMRTACVFRP